VLAVARQLAAAAGDEGRDEAATRSAASAAAARAGTRRPAARATTADARLWSQRERSAATWHAQQRAWRASCVRATPAACG
jgi:hypothetical protein